MMIVKITKIAVAVCDVPNQRLSSESTKTAAP